MKAKTVKRLAILIAVLGLVGGTGFYTQQIQVKKTARDELRKAEAAASSAEKVHVAKAEELYALLLQVFPDDVDIRIKYTKTMLKVDNSPNRVRAALQSYQDIVNRTQRLDARGLLMQLKFDTKHFISQGPQDEAADFDLKILLQNSPNDGNLLFQMGRCQEEADNANNANGAEKRYAKEAAQNYQKAIDHGATERIEAYRRRASLLRDRLDQPEEADRLIKAMVDANPDNDKVYLERGRYRYSLAVKTKEPSSRKRLLLEAKSDFEEARKRAPLEPKVYLELAKVAETQARSDEAIRILEDGRKTIPTSWELYEQLATIYLRDRKIDKAIETLEDGVLKSTAEQAQLRLFLADQLARRGDTGKLLVQIEELKKVGFSQPLVQYLDACYRINKHEFAKARQLLTLIQPTVNRSSNPWLKVRINQLLAQCYGHLNEPEKQRDAILRAASVDPDNLAARLEWIEYMLNQGDTEGAIKEYRKVADQAPEAQLLLARRLIARNKRRPEPERDWSEINRLIDNSAKTAPESPEPAILRAECALTQGKPTVAREELEKARKLFPKSVEIRVAQGTVLALQGRVDEALSLLDQAKNQLGDQVDLRLARARLWTMKKGPEAAKALLDLARNIEVFPKKEDRHKLLYGLATELQGQQHLEEASRLWSQLAEQEPKDMMLRLNLLDLAFQLARTDEIEKNIKQIEEIEGSDGSMGRYCQARYLIWQAKRAGDSSSREAQRTRARLILNELLSRRADWSLIPITLAQLEEQELDQGGLKEEEKRAKEQIIIGFYLQAIKLGYRSQAVMRRTVRLLIESGRGREALELLTSIPVESQLAGDLGRQASQDAIKKGDFQGAEQIAQGRRSPP